MGREGAGGDVRRAGPLDRALLELFQAGGRRATDAVAAAEGALGHRWRAFEADVAELTASRRP